MTTGPYDAVQFTEDGHFKFHARTGATQTGTYQITSGDTSAGHVKCVVDGSGETVEDDFHMNGNILVFQNSMFIRD